MAEIIDYRQAPLGSLPGESHLQAPYNGSAVNVVVEVRNLSAKIKRRCVKEAISIRRGGDKMLNEAAAMAKNKYGVTSVDQLRQRVANGENVDWTEDKIEPIDFLIRHDSKRYEVPAMDKDGEPAPWVTVAPGVWDLYMGNWERMHSNDPRERTDEITQLNGRNLHRFVVGEPDDDRPYGFLEFRRTEIRYTDVAVDREKIRSGRLIEV